MAQIIGLFGVHMLRHQRRDWNSQDIAEFYRVESALVQAGLRIDTERGKSDEGDPWFVFCYADTGEVIVHFARIDGQYIAAASALPKVLKASSLEAIVRSFIDDNPFSLPQPDKREDNVFFHPAALLTIFVATLLLSLKPDESFAAAEINRLDDLPADHPETAFFRYLLNDKYALGDLPLNPFGSDGQDSRPGENALLVAMVAMALEVTKLHRQDGDSRVPQTFMLSDFLPQADQDDSGQEEPAITVPLVEAASADNDSPKQEIYKDVDGTSDVAKLAVIELPSKLSNEVDLALIHVEFDAAATANEIDERPLDEKPLQAYVHSGEIALTDHMPASASLLLADTDSSKSISMFEEIAISFGLQVITVDSEAFSEIDRVVNLAESTGMLSAVDIASPIEGLVFSRTVLPDGVNDDIVQSISRFIGSDSDINMLARHDSGLVLFFDASDIQEGQKSLQMHIWSLDDDVQIAILGHADTISDALVLTA